MAEEDLRQAAKSGDTEKVRNLLASGTKQVADENGETPLFLATSNYITEPKYVEVVRELLDAGGEVNKTNKDGDAPTHNAASMGNLEILELLLENGADLEAEGEAGLVPLGLAATKRHHAAVDLIVTELLESKKFSEKQVKWMFTAPDETHQLSIFRAISSIFKIKEAIPELIRLNVVQAIAEGLKKFTKKSVQTSGLQLLTQALQSAEGIEAAKKGQIAKVVEDSIKQNENDAVVKHFGSDILDLLK